MERKWPMHYSAAHDITREIMNERGTNHQLLHNMTAVRAYAIIRQLRSYNQSKEVLESMQQFIHPIRHVLVRHRHYPPWRTDYGPTPSSNRVSGEQHLQYNSIQQLIIQLNNIAVHIMATGTLSLTQTPSTDKMMDIAELVQELLTNASNGTWWTLGTDALMNTVPMPTSSGIQGIDRHKIPDVLQNLHGRYWLTALTNLFKDPDTIMGKLRDDANHMELRAAGSGLAMIQSLYLQHEDEMSIMHRSAPPHGRWYMYGLHTNKPRLVPAFHLEKMSHIGIFGDDIDEREDNP